MAFSNDLKEPWKIYRGGVRNSIYTRTPQRKATKIRQINGLDDLNPHNASPDVHINNVEKSLEMFLHGLDHGGKQRSLSATASHGLPWQVQPKRINQTYLRVFRYKHKKYALG